MSGPLSVDGFRPVGGQAGSTPGALLEDPGSGRRVYVKRARSVEHVASEVLAGWLYGAAGVAVPDLSLASWGGAPAVASVFLPGLRRLSPLSATPAELAAARRGFAVDAWLANWDVSPMLTPDGEGVRVDVGGALLYRAQGAPKGDRFSDRVGEVDTMRDPKVNPVAAAVFGDMAEAEIAGDFAATAATVTGSTVAELVDGLRFAAGVCRQLRDRLRARQDDLRHRFAAVVAGG